MHLKHPVHSTPSMIFNRNVVNTKFSFQTSYIFINYITCRYATGIVVSICRWATVQSQFPINNRGIKYFTKKSNITSYFIYRSNYKIVMYIIYGIFLHLEIIGNLYVYFYIIYLSNDSFFNQLSMEFINSGFLRVDVLHWLLKPNTTCVYVYAMYLVLWKIGWLISIHLLLKL